ncbi:MAG: glucose-6-phosphate isomerase [Candidatus Magasanikbacteria bacterium CG11_big_fil_rev_8_21_14_0_20_39_34]|uniref:Glucose-6-phosphate isomerase n=1 Tax=Candidatus Magasanikbacteria bacterium CG11_big_fil_rev_8_21_14_0_20_39_34 TaxID=1974653 RepID=A0A2H0N8D0_9BACT|nr:MAG: glucose-6-phosphate isomerase [Candidatus Magasanikbacteria bacterium CG11_big_fil_rev_8_21_14_0_20_39_34]
MLSIDFKNTFKVAKQHGLAQKDLQASKKDLQNLLSDVHSRNQNFYSIVDDTDELKRIAEVASHYKDILHVVVCGIGGSALGTICLQRSLQHLFQEQRKSKKVPQLYILDNIDPTMMVEILDVIDLPKTLFLIVSKSGTTPEPISQYMYFKNLIKKAKLNPEKHILFITDPEKGVLREIHEREGIPMVPHGPVGGRFSVLSSVGLTPATFAGMDTKSLLKGARDMRDLFLSTDAKKNLPFQLARAQYLLEKKGKTINVMMPYAQKLAFMADWYRQLLAESIGKEKTRSGKMVNVGITPVKALGTTDQHSQAQLYNEGPKDKLIMVLAVKNLHKTVPIPMLHKELPELQYMKGASFNKLIDVERIATCNAYTKYDVPNLTIHIDTVDAYHVGALFMLFEASIAFLGEFYNIDAFNQPGVELAKNLTRKNLSRA